MKKVFSYLLIVFLSFTLIAFTGCDENKPNYVISTFVYGARFGDVYGPNGSYEEGSEVTVLAVPRKTLSQNDENVFVAWIHDYSVVSTSTQYTFVVDSGTAGDYIAVFQNKQSDLEFVSPVGFTLEFGSFIEADSNIDVSSYQISFGQYENELYKIYEADAENNSMANVVSIYEDDRLPFVFNKTEDLYVKVVINYSKNDFDYIATAIKKINKVNLGQMPEIEISDEFTSANLKGAETGMEFSTKPSLSITVNKLADLILFDEE